MHIILATYNYYPYAWGGSEVYVHGLAKYLQSIGNQVLVIAAAGKAKIENASFTYYDQILQVQEYEYDGVKVLGATLNHEDTEEIYSKYNPNHVSSWLKMMQKHIFFANSVAIFHYNGYTGLISTALLEALQVHQKNNKNPQTKVITSYHTPISCPNGKLLYFQKQACEVKPNVNICTACLLNDKKNIPANIANLLSLALPKAHIPDRLPTAFKLKKLVNLAIKSFQLLDNQTNQWLVMSNYIEQTIILAGVNPEKIKIIRHGIHADFLESPIVNEQNLAQAQEQRNTKTFVYAGRFEKIKGVHTLLAAWLALPCEPEKRTIQLIGEVQTEYIEINELIEKAKKRTDVIFLGKKDAKAMKQVLQTAACMIIPSEWVEIGPLVLHEAIACGANVLASAIGGTKELAKFYGQGCQTFEMGNIADLQNKILQFTYQPITHKVQSQVAHYQQVVENY
jgi:glycosyltransferase involved in cell wall biosynthesis